MSASIAASVATTETSEVTASPQPEGPRQSQRVRVARVLAALAAVLLLMFPVYWMLRTSLASTNELSTLPVPLWPQQWLWENYVEPWRQFPFARWLTNSVVIAIVSVVLTVMINLCAGYAFAKLRFPGRNLLFLLILSTLMVPVQVIMIPQFQIVIDLGLLNSTWGVVLPRLAEAFGLFMARQFFMSFPDELLEAARIDGAGHLRTFWKIVLPAASPSARAFVTASTAEARPSLAALASVNRNSLLEVVQYGWLPR